MVDSGCSSRGAVPARNAMPRSHRFWAIPPQTLPRGAHLARFVVLLAGACLLAPASRSAAPQAQPPSPPVEMSVGLLVQDVLARNPSLAEMTAAWQAALARYPQVTSLDDPMFGAM